MARFLLASVLILLGISFSAFIFYNDGGNPNKGVVRSCASRNFGYDSDVCVCNSTYCDDVEPLPPLPTGRLVSYTTTKSGRRFYQETTNFQPVSGGHFTQGYFNVSISKKYQTIKGFGGAFTDAAGINILNLSEDAQSNLLKSYFSPSGIEYNIGRIPMAGCDFSTRVYTYDDHDGDFTMAQFALQMEDFTYKIPLISKAKGMSNKTMSFFGSPWSAPTWMKDNHNISGKGSLIGSPGGQYYESWALYFAKFIENYEANGIKIWAVSAQNEPTDGTLDNFPFNCMGFTAEQQRDFVKLDLGPVLEQHGYGDVKLMIMDDQRLLLPGWAQTVLSDPDAAKYIDGIAVHWYTDEIVPANVLSQTHDLFPNKFILGSEACAGEIPMEKYHVHLGSWFRGQRYSLDIIQDLEHWVSGWVDWNLALDMEGGPNWVSNFVDALIIVNKDKDEFYKQPSFYHMGHFSKFIEENSVRVDTSIVDISGFVKQVGFLLPDLRTRVLVVVNVGRTEQHIQIYDSAEDSAAKVTLESDSIKTFVWKY